MGQQTSEGVSQIWRMEDFRSDNCGWKWFHHPSRWNKCHLTCCAEWISPPKDYKKSPQCRGPTAYCLKECCCVFASIVSASVDFWEELNVALWVTTRGSVNWKKGTWLLSGNCRYSLFSVLRGALLSCNSGCQVKERRLWDGVSSSPGLLNWLCYCRPVQGEGSARESGLRFI